MVADIETIWWFYQGDPLYQNSDDQYVATSFQLKNPKSHKLQTYYEYGVVPEFNFFQPIYFLQDKSHSVAERQDFFDDYQSDGMTNYWIRNSRSRITPDCSMQFGVILLYSFLIYQTSLPQSNIL